MKISKRTREQAALILAIGASTPHAPSDAWDTIGISSAGHIGQLVRLVIVEPRRRLGLAHDLMSKRWPEVYAEAEAMLRTGWTP